LIKNSIEKLKKDTQFVDINMFEGHTSEKIFNSIFRTAVARKFGIAVWRSPLNTELNCIVSTSSEPSWCIPDLETMDKGFIFSPYDNEDNQRVLFLNSDIHFILDSKHELKIEKASNSTLPYETDIFLDEIFNSLNHPFQNINYYSIEPVPAKRTGKGHFIKNIKLTIESIKAGKFDKAVPTRCKPVSYIDEINPVHSFFSVSRNYPNSFISLVSTPYAGTWLGASPEILISIENNEVFKTASVAGTQEYKPGIKLSEFAWTQKEIEEQALVSRYIINCFKKIRLREFSEFGPKTLKAGNLVHLKTLFSVNMKETSFPQLGSVMLKLLHPTSAVCGMPGDEARKFLSEIEGYDRLFYSGYLGPVNLNGNTSLFVNIRCANILKKKAIFYAGAGVTVDSNPQKEWHETELKIQTISKFIG
jgi:isochorismate synthase